MSEIKIIAGDPDFLVREGLASLMSNVTDFELVANVSEFPDLMEAARNHQPDVIIFDYHRYREGWESIKMLRKQVPEAGILIIADPRNKTDIRKALDAGAHAYLLRECEKEEIYQAIAKVAIQESFLCGRILARLDMQDADEKSFSETSCYGLNITEREMEIIRMVAEGFSNKEIAEKLFLSTHTVTTHRKNIMSKLQVNNTAGLVLYAVRNDILAPNKFLFS
ncbi:MAG TPA: response regulator transcription factor [Bacteroidia bacterium]|jgi:DNA-binding NarL/FixJ family response regulator|nr:response regulator transcription factor [Bacteroidia bacterium]